MDKYVWNDCVFIAVITIPENSLRIEKLFTNLHENNLPEAYISFGKPYSHFI